MAKLSKEEAAALGLPVDGAPPANDSGKKLSPEEAAALGLPDTVPASPVPLQEEKSWLDRAGNAIVGAANEVPGHLRSAMQGVTGGFSDELGAYLESKFPILSLTPEEILSGVKPKEKTYSEARKELSEIQEKAVEEHPVANVAGAFAMPIPGPGKATGAAKLAKMALGGAAASALTELGTSEKPLNEAGKDAVAAGGVGAVVGAGAGKLSEKMTGLAKKFAPKLKEFAEERAVKAAGPMLANARAMVRKGDGKVNEIGRLLLDEKIVTAGASLDDIAQRSWDAAQEQGLKIGYITKHLDKIMSEADDEVIDGVRRQAPGFVPAKAADRIEQELIAPLKDVPAYDSVVSELQRQADRLRAMGSTTIPYSKAQKLKRGYDEFLNWDKEQTPLKEKQKQVRGIVNDEIQDAASKLMAPKEAGKPEFLVNKLREANRKYGDLTDIADMSKDRLQREYVNRVVSPSDYIAAIGGMGIGGTAGGHLGGGLGAGIGGPVGALVSGGINHLARRYGNPVLAVGADKASKALPKMGDGAGPTHALVKALVGSSLLRDSQYGQLLAKTLDERGMDGLLALDYALSKHNPEYAELREKALAGEG